ncbi:MAG: 50S ribosomal protein L18 [Chloroflexota bacterium]
MAMDVRSARQRRHKRVRKTVQGIPSRPRLCVFRSVRHIYGQVIDDTRSHTLVAASTLDAEIKDKVDKQTKKEEGAKMVGSLLGRRAVEQGIGQVAFDRGGYKYQGRVKALADAAREAGLKF